MKTWADRCLPIAALAAVWALGPTAAGDEDWQTLIQQALDQNTDLIIEEQPIAEALAYIGQKTGVSIEIDPQVIDLLPYGRQTAVSATIRNISLRDGLAGFLRPIGLNCVVQANRLRAVPVPALLRVGRRVTWEELKVLAELGSRPWSSELSAGLRTVFEGELLREPDPAGRLHERALRVGAGNGLTVLEAACESLGWVWYPDGERVIVTGAVDFGRKRLAHVASFNLREMPLASVLTELGREAGLLVRFEPGSLAALPAGVRERCTLCAQNISYEQAFELIAGASGLVYEVRGDGVWLTGASPGAGGEPPRPAAGGDPYLMKISVPSADDGCTIEWLVRQSELPPEVIELRQQQIAEVIARLTDGDPVPKPQGSSPRQTSE